MMVNLGDGIVVNPAHVVSITREFYDRFLLVKTVLGEVHEVKPKYGESIYDAEKRVMGMMG